jgi:hypothetical protein
VCAGRAEPHKGMQNVDARLDHKAILNFPWKCGKTMGPRRKVCLHAPLGLTLYP